MGRVRYSGRTKNSGVARQRGVELQEEYAGVGTLVPLGYVSVGKGTGELRGAASRAGRRPTKKKC